MHMQTFSNFGFYELEQCFPVVLFVFNQFVLLGNLSNLDLALSESKRVNYSKNRRKLAKQ